MVTGASNADAADPARRRAPRHRCRRRAGTLPLAQPARHPRTWSLSVNKMDLVGYVARRLRARARGLRCASPRRSASRRSTSIPVSALRRRHGGRARRRRSPGTRPDAARAPRDAARRRRDARRPGRSASRCSSCRARRRGAPRGYLGRIESGHVLAGAEVALLPSGRRTPRARRS